MKRTFAFFATFLISISLFAQAKNSSAAAANKRTAIRYLQNAKQQAADKCWAEADSLSQIGLEYDNSIADLWYIHAVSRYNLGDSRAVVLPMIEKTLNGECPNWVDYNKDNARILYADILCSTLHFKEALKVLDAEPFIYSADAEYIRVKSYYNLTDDDNLRKARSRLDTARRVYPEDTRFVELFYNFEYKLNVLNRSPEDEIQINQDVQKIANSFAAAIKSGKYYKNLSDDLQLLSIVFEQNSEERVRKLRAFNSEGHKSIHFAEHALLDGVFDDITAVDYFYKYSDSTESIPVNFDVLKSFVLRLTKDDVKKEIVEYLNSYNGTIVFDTDGDLESNMKVLYKRGRPEHVDFDKNQDGVYDWSASCDFGVPQSVHLTENNLDLIYGNWPAIQSAVYNLEKDINKAKDAESKNTTLSFNLLADTLLWSPFNIETDAVLKEKLALDFFMPVLPSKKSVVTGSQLLISSSYYTMPSVERPDSFIQVSVLSGVPQSSKYFEGDASDIETAKLYAVAKFEHGVPVLRLVDSDGDGLFETTESYGITTDFEKGYITESDEMQVIANLFGAPASKTGFYVKLIQLDKNGDTIPDFIEEYTEGYGKISSWDTNSDGNWDVKYVKHPIQQKNSDKKAVVKEDALFHQPFTNEVVTVSCENGKPVNISVGSTKIKVSSSKSSKNFYWLYDIDAEFAIVAEERILKEFVNEAQGVSKIVQLSTPLDTRTDGMRFYAVKIGDMIFAEQIKK